MSDDPNPKNEPQAITASSLDRTNIVLWDAKLDNVEIRCWDCAGTGTDYVTEQPCDTCQGHGKLVQFKCPTCGYCETISKNVFDKGISECSLCQKKEELK